MSLHAFSLTVGIDDNSHEQLIKSFGQGIITNKYPPCTSFYCDGELKSFNLVGLPLQTQKNGLAGIHDATDAQSQIASFLKSTRKSKAQYHREKLQASAAAIVNRKGEKLKTFKAENWKSITDKLGPTTIFDMLYRLRIKANYRDVQTFMEADIDFLKFHQYLQTVVGYLNFIHEAYMAKAIGKNRFAALVKGFPNHPSDSIIQARWEQRILPLLT